MRKLKIDLQDLALAFGTSGSEMHRAYLDLETGRIITIADSDYDELEDEDDDSLDDDALNEDMSDDEDLSQDENEDEDDECIPGPPTWQQEERTLAREIAAHFGTRYIEVPSDDTREAYRDMEDFIDTVEEPRLRRRLENAICGRGAFRRFKDVLSESFHERERWFRFSDARVEERIREWLESEDIELIEVPGEQERKEQQRLDDQVQTREDLIAGVLNAVREMRELAGVLKIALIGSLATKQPEPKDADLLVTISDDVDLPTLAQFARRLQGRAQQLNRGADVFLLDPSGRYLGRTCLWKDCRPGVRLSCDALHCGERPFLHDDLQAITLKKDVTANPPIELWPRITARVPVPEDIKLGLIEQLVISNRDSQSESQP